MGPDVGRRVTGIAAVAAVLLFIFGAFGYLRTSSNAERIHDRNLRELSRIGGAVEGMVNNLPTVLRNLAEEANGSTLAERVALIPHLRVDTANLTRAGCTRGSPGSQARFRYDPGAEHLRLCFLADRGGATFGASYDLAAVRPALRSQYFESVFVADERGTVFLRGPQRSTVRVDDLSAVDSLNVRLPDQPSGVGLTRIVRAPIAGRDYFFYLVPLRIGMGAAPEADDESVEEESRWMVGGLVRASAHRQESLSLHPRAALVLAFLIVLTLLAAPFVRVFTIGPRERLGIGHLLYIVLALVLAAGLAGLGLAHFSHHRGLQQTTYQELDQTADALFANVKAEIKAALLQLDALSSQLVRSLDSAQVALGRQGGPPLDPELRDRLEPVFMRTAVQPEPLLYPHFQMAFWTDPAGWQLAKWTPRQRNTPRIDVADREYFRAVRENRGWPIPVELGTAAACRRAAPLAGEPSDSGRSGYTMEFVRSWTTGEKLAVIATEFCWPGGDSPGAPGIVAMTTEFSALRTPVLPAGVGAALVDAEGRTLFSTLPDRGLEEHFGEETDRIQLVQSVLSARAARAVDVKYGVRHTRLVIRPMADRPLFLVTFYNRSLLDAVGFAAWFSGGALFGALTLGLLGLVLLAERIEPTRIGWLWPELDGAGKYVAFLAMAAPFLAVLGLHAAMTDRLPVDGAALLIPVLFLGLGLVVLSTSAREGAGARQARGSTLGWVLYAAALVALVGLAIAWRRIPGLELTAALLGLAIAVVWSRERPLRERVNGIRRYVRPRVLYTAALVAGVLVVSLLPGYLSYQLAHLDGASRLVRYHHLHVLEGLQARELRQDSAVRQIARPDDRFRVALRASELDLAFQDLLHGTVSTTDIGDRWKGAGPVWRGFERPLRLLGDRAPFLTDVSVQLRQLSDPTQDRSWTTASQGRTSRIWVDAPAAAEGDPVLASTLPSPAGRWDGPWLVALLSALVAIAATVYWAARRVFFIHLEHAPPLRLEQALPRPGQPWHSMMLIGTRSMSRAPLLERQDEILHVDLLSVRRDEHGLPTLGLEAGSGIGAICLDNFDHRLGEAAWNRRVLEFLERHLSSANPVSVVLLTSRDPEEILSGAEAVIDLSVEERRRWERVFGRFLKIILCDVQSPATFRLAVERRTVDVLRADLRKEFEVLTALGREPDGAIRRWRVAWRLGLVEAKLRWLAEAHRAAGEKVRAFRFVGTPGAEGDPEHIDQRVDEVRGVLAEQGILGDLASGQTAAAPAHSSPSAVHAEADDGGTAGAPEEAAVSVVGPEVETLATIRVAGAESPARYRIPIGGIALGSAPLVRRLASRVVRRQRRRVEALRDVLISECGHRQRLQEIGLRILDKPEFFRLDADEVVELVREWGDAFYAARWAILTERERLVLGQLAAGAAVSPRSRQEVTRLYARGFVERGPELRLDTESFSRFVQDRTPPALLNEWEHSGESSRWEMIQGPLVLAWIGVALFLFWAQRDLLSNTVALLTTIGAGLAVVLRLVSSFERGSGSDGGK